MAICDYGAGNVRSVEVAFRRLGAVIVDDPAGAELTVLPGVGSAASAMDGLRVRGLDTMLRDRFRSGRAVLGICLGLQLALEESEEDGGVPGLGFLPGRAVRLVDGRVPRIGWAPVEPEAGSVGVRAADARSEDRVASGAPGGDAFYFAHSYAAETPAATAFSEGYVAEAAAGTFLGVQFHPEKSGGAGARFLERCLSRV